MRHSTLNIRIYRVIMCRFEMFFAKIVDISGATLWRGGECWSKEGAITAAKQAIKML